MSILKTKSTQQPLPSTLTNIKIKTKLTTSFSILIIISIILVIFGIYNMRRISTLGQEMYNNNTVGIAELNQLSTSYQRVRVNLRDIIIDTDQDSMKNYATAIISLNKDIDEVYAKFKSHVNVDVIKTELNELDTDLEKYKPIISKITQLALENKNEEAIALLRINLQTANDLNNSIQQLVEKQLERAELKDKENNQIVTQSVRVFFLTLLFVLLMSVLLVMYIVKSINTPIQKLINSADKIANGDLTGSIEDFGDTEMGLLAKSISKMKDNLKFAISQVADKSTTLSASSQQMVASNQQLNATIQDTAETMTQISTSIQDIAKNINDMAVKTKQSNELVISGKNKMNTVRNQMDKIISSNSNITISMKELDEKLKDIDSMVNVISEIADRTDLLALNTAIEASKIKDQNGGSFLVIAREIKSLSEKSNENLKVIKNLINEIQKQSDIVEFNLNKGNLEVTNGNDITIEADRNFESILININNLTEQMQTISANSQEITASIETVASTTEEQTASMQELTSLSQSLAELSIELQELTTKFQLK